MAPVYMTSINKIQTIAKSWTVEIESDDNESYTFEVNAANAQSAAHKATALAASQGVYNIYNMSIYQF